MRCDPLQTRLGILFALAEEQAKPEPSEVVITACEVALRVMRAPIRTSYMDKSQPNT